MLFLFLSMFVALGAALPQSNPAASSTNPTLDVNNPSSGDPSSPPKTLPALSKSVNPWASGGIPIVPSACTDASNPSEDCFKAFAAQASADGSVHVLGGYLSHDGSCKDGKETQLETAAWDATTLANQGVHWPIGPRGAAAGKYWMGPDYLNQEKRIQDNFVRAADFKQTGNSYITVSCKDTKNICDTGTQGQAVGGYAWTTTGWFGYKYYFITLCPPFFTIETLDTQFQTRQDELARGDTSKVTDMSWLKNTGQYFLHEMMHTALIGQPKIIDEFVSDVGNTGRRAYGAANVHSLAQRPLSDGGGATRASTNADSYAMLANCLFWWGETNYFPGVPVSKSDNANPSNTNLDPGPISLFIDLGNTTDTSAVDFTSLFNADFQAFAANSGSTSTPSAPTASSSSPPSSSKTASSPPPISSSSTTVDTCGDKYEFFFDHFEIQGKNFDASKFGTDGSGLKKQIEGCGALTKWSFKQLTNSNFQWSASGNLPIGTKACVGRAVISAGGSSKDGCTGAG